MVGKTVDDIEEKPGERYYLARGKNGEFYHVTRRKNMKILCDDGKVRRFCNGVYDSKVFGGDNLPVICAECRYDFNVFDIYERTIPYLKQHVCKED